MPDPSTIIWNSFAITRFSYNNAEMHGISALDAVNATQLLNLAGIQTRLQHTQLLAKTAKCKLPFTWGPHDARIFDGVWISASDARVLASTLNLTDIACDFFATLSQDSDDDEEADPPSVLTKNQLLNLDSENNNDNGAGLLNAVFAKREHGCEITIKSEEPIGFDADVKIESPDELDSNSTAISLNNSSQKYNRKRSSKDPWGKDPFELYERLAGSEIIPFSLPKEYGIADWKENKDQIVLVTSGRLQVIFHETRVCFHAKAGHLFFLPSGVRYTLQNIHNGETRFLYEQGYQKNKFDE
ncbi:hypothetical protein BDR26DRAFT_852826 [Obelidium mucronatum]|nr:hypothetical protein BDR26DRAFT_852826 [Obelidium mucronatum]